MTLQSKSTKFNKVISNNYMKKLFKSLLSLIKCQKKID